LLVGRPSGRVGWLSGEKWGNRKKSGLCTGRKTAINTRGDHLKRSVKGGEKGHLVKKNQTGGLLWRGMICEYGGREKKIRSTNRKWRELLRGPEGGVRSFQLAAFQLGKGGVECFARAPRGGISCLKTTSTVAGRKRNGKKVDIGEEKKRNFSEKGREKRSPIYCRGPNRAA